jgi:hypothetical protein
MKNPYLAESTLANQFSSRAASTLFTAKLSTIYGKPRGKLCLKVNPGR